MDLFKTMKMLMLPLMVLAILMTGATCQTPKVEMEAGQGGDVVVTGVSMPEANKVIIEGKGELVGNAFPMNDPIRVTVDVQGAAMGSGVKKSIKGRGAVEKVEVEAIDYLSPPVVRVTAYLAEDAEYNIETLEGDIHLTIISEGEPGDYTATEPDMDTVPDEAEWAGGEQAGMDEPMPADSPPTEAMMEPEEAAGEGDLSYKEVRQEMERIMSGQGPEPVGDDYEFAPRETPPQYPPMLPSMPPPAADGSATVIGDIVYRTSDETVQIMILTNGYVRDFVDFDLPGSRAKIVVDIPGVSIESKKKVFPVKWAGVKQVRLGPHMDKSRAVIDLYGNLQAYTVDRTRSGVVVTVYKLPYVPGGLNYRKFRTGSGDSLRSIAQREYGYAGAWPRLLSSNRDKFTRQERENIRKSDGGYPLGQNIDIRVPVR